MATDVVLETSMGSITLELYAAHAPKTVLNFTTLLRRKYYDNIPIHRIIPDFMIQAGDPTGTGRGGEAIFPGGKFEDELTPPRESTGLNVLKHTGAGVVSMANSGPNTNGSQFFITLAPTPWLDGKHTVFGRVKGGMAEVKRLGMVRTGEGDRPVEDIRILRGWVVGDGGKEGGA